MLIIPNKDEKGDAGKDGHVSHSEGFSHQATSTGLQNKAHVGTHIGATFSNILGPLLHFLMANQ